MVERVQAIPDVLLSKYKFSVFYFVQCRNWIQW